MPSDAAAPPRCPVCLVPAPPEEPAGPGRTPCGTCGWILYGPPVLGRPTADDEREFAERLRAGQRGFDLLACARAAGPGRTARLEALVRGGPVRPEERRRAELAAAGELAALGVADVGGREAAERFGGEGGEVVVVEITDERVTATRFDLTGPEHAADARRGGAIELADLRVADWSALVPGLPADPVERAFALAGGIGARPVPCPAADLEPQLGHLAGTEDRVIVVNRVPGWPLPDLAAEAILRRHPPARRLAARPAPARPAPEAVRLRGRITACAIRTGVDGRAAVAAGGPDGSATVWTLPGAARRALDTAHTARVTAVDVSADLLVSGDAEGVVLGRPLGGGAPEPLVVHLGRVTGVRACGGAVFSLGADGTLHRTPIAEGPAYAVDVTISAASALAATDDGTVVATGGTDTVIRLWDGHSGDRRHAIRAAGRITALAFAPDGETLAVGHSDGTLAVCDLRSYRVTALGRGGAAVRAVAVGPDGALVAGDDAGLVRVRHRRNGSGTVVGEHRSAAVKALAAHAGRLVSADAGGLVRLWPHALTEEDAGGRAPGRRG